MFSWRNEKNIGTLWIKSAGAMFTAAKYAEILQSHNISNSQYSSFDIKPGEMSCHTNFIMTSPYDN